VAFEESVAAPASGADFDSEDDRSATPVCGPACGSAKQIIRPESIAMKPAVATIKISNLSVIPVSLNNATR
jgi:hypothetical protein